MSTPSLTDMDSCMNAAEEINACPDDTYEIDPADLIQNVRQLSGAPQSSSWQGLTSQPSISPADVNRAITSANVSEALNRVTENPGELTRAVEQSMSQMSPEAMEQARKIARGGQGEQIIKEMQRRGMNPKDMRKRILAEKRMLKGTNPVGKTQSVILITTSRKIRVRRISPENIKASAENMLSTDAIQAPCSRLARGPLAKSEINVWYNPKIKGRNKRASKIIGFPVAGEMLIVASGSDLTEKDFVAAEKQLR